jgi:hypothetical protein
MGIELYPQSTSLVPGWRCRPLQFQLEPNGVKFAISFGSVLVCLRRGCGGEGGIVDSIACGAAREGVFGTHAGPVKPFENVTLAMIVETFEM